jgi:periplasmic protein TonB
MEMLMERPAYFAKFGGHNRGRLGSAATVALIHVAAIFGLVTALNPGALMKEIRIIQATIDAPQEILREPPPAPRDIVKPTPPVAILPIFTVQEPISAAPSITTVPVKPQPVPTPAANAPVTFTAPPNDPLRAIMSTHTLPPYPPIAKRLNEQGTTLMELTISPRGNVSDCRIVESSRSERLDGAGCDFVTSNWRWQPPTSAGKAISAKTHVSIKWDLRNAD